MKGSIYMKDVFVIVMSILNSLKELIFVRYWINWRWEKHKKGGLN